MIIDTHSPITTAVAVAGATAAVWASSKLLQHALQLLNSPLRELRGPKNDSWIFGNLKAIFAADNSVLHEKWFAEYGHTIAYTTFLGNLRIATMDPRALNHVLMTTSIYQKPAQIRYTLGQLLGEGVLFAEGETHTRQRKIMNPSFSNGQIRQLTDVFIAKSVELRDIWLQQVHNAGGELEVGGLSWLSRATLDIIGLAGFNYTINALELGEETNELSLAFRDILGVAGQGRWFTLLRAMFPPLRIIRDKRSVAVERSQRVMRTIGQRLLDEKKKAVLDSGDSVPSREDLTGRDLLSLLVKANMGSDLKESQKLSDEEVLNQIPTFLIAGHETTSTSTTWALYSLTEHPEMQTKLREELQSVNTDTPTMEELNALPYLDAVVRETLRVHAVVGSTVRVATKEDVIPTSTPYKDAKGNVRNEIKVAKGSSIFIPILALNRDKSIWGEDSFEFKPERWFSLPESTSTIPGVAPGLMTFIGGPRGCIGYKFAIIEMKALLFTLIRAFEFELTVQHSDIQKKAAITTRPVLKSEETLKDRQAKLPLKLRPVKNL